MHASWVVTVGIGALAVLVAGGFVIAYSLAVERLGGRRVYARMTARSTMLAWMACFAVLAESGVLARFDQRPPPLLLAMVASVAAGVLLGLSKVGDTFARGLHVGWLILAQGFRLPLELIMYQAAREGVMPLEMSLAGYNFDVLTGLSALVLGTLALRRGVSFGVVLAWNVAGSVLLAVVLTVALLASPMVRAFGDDPAHLNRWIAYFPFVWLPAVLVSSAAFGHTVIFRLLRARSTSSRAPASSPSSS